MSKLHLFEKWELKKNEGNFDLIRGGQAELLSIFEEKFSVKPQLSQECMK